MGDWMGIERLKQEGICVLSILFSQKSYALVNRQSLGRITC